MMKFLLGLLCGLLLAGMAVVILVFSLLRFSEHKPVIPENAALLLKLEGGVPEKPGVEIPLPAFEEQAAPTVRDIWSMLRHAAADSRIKALVVAPRNLQAGWAKLDELRQSILAFKKSGKPVYAFLRLPGAREYYLATAADKIYAAPDDFVDLKGLRLDVMYFKNSLDKLGVEMQVEHAGKYKDAMDMFTRTSMAPETREVLNQVLDQIYDSLCATIAVGRKKSPAAVKALIDQGPFVAKDALANGLVDALGYEDGVIADAGSRAGAGQLKRLQHREYLRSYEIDDSRTKIALIVGAGEITQGSGDEGFGDVGIRSEAFLKLLRTVKADASIKGVIVRIDSPGGDAIASDDILHEMKEMSRLKPTVISMSDVAASGGYFMAMTGDPILAYPNTITGSIGVISAKVNLHGLYEKLGVKKEMLTRGRFATLDSEYKPMDAAERAKLRESVDATYRAFVSRVAQGRRRKLEDIEPLAEGRVWMGAQAKQNGLVDEFGGLDRAIELIREKARIPAAQGIELVPYPPKRSLFDLLFGRSDAVNVAEVRLLMLLRQVPGGLDWILPAMRGGVLALMPVSIQVY